MSGEADGLNRLEEEVRELREGFQEAVDQLSRTVEDLKRAVVDIRSTITEIENPFNLLRVISSEEEFQRAQRLAEQQAPAKPVEEVQEPQEKPQEAPPEPPGRPLGEVDRHLSGAGPTGFETGFSVIKWVWALLDAGLDREDVLNLSRYCECAGYLPPRSSEYVGYLVDAMSKARIGGLNLEEFMLIIYGAAKASGLKLEMKELEEVAFTLLRRILKKINISYERG